MLGTPDLIWDFKKRWTMRRIGLIGGMSWESTATYYRYLNEKVRDTLGGLHSADIIMHSVDFARVVELQTAGNWGRATELLFTGRDMTAEEGLAWGFYNRIADDAQAEAQALAEQLARGPSVAHAVTKRQLDAEWHVSIEEALELEARAQARCMETNDFKRAYEAFANKQKPVFQGD